MGVGVVVSLLLQLNQEAIDLSERAEPPATLADGSIVVLNVYGSLFYAGARTLQARLPDPTGSRQPVVLLRLRGRTTLGATFFTVVADYAEQLAKAGGRLYLTGLDPALAAYRDATTRLVAHEERNDAN